jgi:hypothetical protein
LDQIRDYGGVDASFEEEVSEHELGLALVLMHHVVDTDGERVANEALLADGHIYAYLASPDPQLDLEHVDQEVDFVPHNRDSQVLLVRTPDSQQHASSQDCLCKTSRPHLLVVDVRVLLDLLRSLAADDVPLDEAVDIVLVLLHLAHFPALLSFTLSFVKWLQLSVKVGFELEFFVELDEVFGR